MTTDQSVPATKQDIAMLMEQVGNYYDRTEQRFEEMKLYFDVAVEKFELTVRTINLEKIFEHDERIKRLELHAGIPWAV